MKHITRISTNRPQKANRIQEIVCDVAVFLGLLLGAFGGAAPTLEFAVDKCDLPVPGDGSV